MKKLIMMVALALMAVCAQAEYTYTFSVDVFNLPTTYHTCYYLRDVESNTILAYATAKELSYYRSGTVEEPHRDTFSHNAVSAASDTYFKNPNEAAIVEHTLTDISSTAGVALGDSSQWKLTVSFKSEMSPEAYDEGHPKVLELVAFNESGDAVVGAGGQNSVGYIQTIDANYKPVGGAFTGSYTYPTLTITAEEAVKDYDGLPTNATYTVSDESVTVTVAYSTNSGKTWMDEEDWDPVKYTDRTNLLARFAATKKGWDPVYSVPVQVWIKPIPVNVHAPKGLVYDDLEKPDEEIDEDIKAKITIENVLEGEEDKITVDNWVRTGKIGAREEDTDYAITFVDEDGESVEGYQFEQGNYLVSYWDGDFRFEEPEPEACPRCLCLCNCGKRTYTGTIVNNGENGEELAGTITLTMVKSSKAGHADVTATVMTADRKTLKFKKDGVMICGCRDTKTTCTSKCVSKCGIFGFGSLGSQKLADEDYDYSKELGRDVKFYEGWGECTCGCGSDEGHDECKTWKKDCGRCYWAKKGRKCHKTCCKYDFGFGKSECDFSHCDFTGCYKTKTACDWGKIGCDWDKYVCDWSKSPCTSSKKSCLSSKSICGLFKSFCDSNKKCCTPSKYTCKSSKASCCTKKFFCWHKYTCKPVCVKKTTCCRKTECSKPKTRCIILAPLVIEMEQTGLSFRQSATHALTVEITGDSIEGTILTSNKHFEIRGGSKVDLASGDPKAEVAKNVTDATYVVSFSREDADVTAGQFSVRVAGDGIVKANGTIDGLSYSGTSDLVMNSNGDIEIPVIATDKKGDVIVFKIDAPVVDEADVVELNIANVIHKGEVLVPAEIEIEEDAAAASAKPYDVAPALYMGKGYKFIPNTLE